MIHTGHRLHIYKKAHHVVTASLVLFLPIILLLIIGQLSNVAIRPLGIALAGSFLKLLAAYALSLFAAVVLAVAFSYSAWGESMVPVLDVLQNVPSFALIPIFALLFGYTSTMAILFAATAIVWPILFYALSAMRTARTDWHDAATVFGATGWQRVWHYLLPVSFPALITGSIVGLSIGWEAIIGVEIIGGTGGIGSFLNRASTGQGQPSLWVGIAAILILVFLINKLVWLPLVKRTQSYAE